MKNEFRIESQKHGQARVWRNGAELHGITSVSTSIGIDRANLVTITFGADKINTAAPPLVGNTGPERVQVGG